MFVAKIMFCTQKTRPPTGFKCKSEEKSPKKKTVQEVMADLTNNIIQSDLYLCFIYLENRLPIMYARLQINCKNSFRLHTFDSLYESGLQQLL